MRALNIAVVGATGLVGEAMLRVLNERKFPINELHALASEKSVGQTVYCGNQQLDVENIETFDFRDVDIAFFSAGNAVSEQHVPRAVDSGCIVIDNSSFYRYDSNVPLVIPEVNPECIAEYQTRGIIANPNCSTIQMLVALKPLHDAAGIVRINVATYQAVAGTGREAITELIEQMKELLNGRPIAKPAVYPEQIAFNVIPHIDCFEANGYSREEMKMVWETQKILKNEQIAVNPTAVRVPVLYGHSEAVHVEFSSPLSAENARAILAKAPGVKVVDNLKKSQYPTVIAHAFDQDSVYVGRIRNDISHVNGLNLWIVADNVRKGAATNAIQIAEILRSDYL